MAITRLIAGASLVLLALAITPVAQAENAGDGTTVTSSHKVVDPAKKAARQAKRKQQRATQKQKGTPGQPGSSTGAPAETAPN